MGFVSSACGFAVLIALAILVLHHLEPKIVAPLFKLLHERGLLPSRFGAPDQRDWQSELPAEFQASAAAYVGKKKKKKKNVRKPASNKMQSKSTAGNSASESEEEEEETLKPSRKTGSVSVYRGGPLKSGTTQAAASPNTAEHVDSPTGSDESFVLVGAGSVSDNVGIEFAEEDEGWGTVDVKKKAHMKRIAKAKAAEEAEANRPGGEVGADGLTYKQRQNRRRAEKKKAERELVEKLRREGAHRKHR